MPPSAPQGLQSNQHPLLALRDVSKTYGQGAAQVRALSGANLDVRSGELVAIMGPSGSGKSTMLTIAGGLERPSDGEVFVAGDDLAGFTSKQLSAIRRTSIGFVFQEFNLLGGLTALENVAMPLELDGVNVRDAKAQARSALERVGIADRSKHFPDDLSGGERQRVAIARAVVGERQLVLADEPTGALDSVNGESILRVLRGVADSGTAVVIVTHDAHLAAWADRVVFLRDGHVTGETKPSGPESLIDAATTR